MKGQVHSLGPYQPTVPMALSHLQFPPLKATRSLPHKIPTRPLLHSKTFHGSCDPQARGAQTPSDGDNGAHWRDEKTEAQCGEVTPGPPGFLGSPRPQTSPTRPRLSCSFTHAAHSSRSSCYPALCSSLPPSHLSFSFPPFPASTQLSPFFR